MKWTQVSDSLIQAQGRGFTFGVRKLSTGEYLVKKDSLTNGQDRATVKTQSEGIRLAESWDSKR